MNDETLEQEIWRKAVWKLDDELLRACPTLVGGKKGSETTEQYAERALRAIRDALNRLAEAKAHYRRLGGLIEP